MVNSRRFTVQILGDAKGAKKAVSDTESALGHLSVTGRVTTGGLRVIGTGLKGLGIAAAGFGVATGAAMLAAGKSVIQLGIDYQNQLNNMQAVTHATGATMDQVAQRARDLGNDLTLPATSAADAANAMVELAKGNLTAQQAMDAAKGTLQLAAAAQIDGAQAATIQADALNAFGLQATNASHVADVLANAANAATGEITDFAQGLQSSSAVAHTFGIGLDDTVTALALLANAGIKGSDAGTSLKTTLISLASPSDKAAGALKTLGVNAFDAHGNFEGLEKLSGQLADAQGRLTKQTFNAAAATAFGTDGVRTASVLANAGAQGFDKMAAAIGRQGGAAQVAQAKTKGLGGAIQGLQSQLETVKIDAFTREAPNLEKFIRALSDRLPAAAEAALHGLDSMTSFVEGEVPKARVAVEKFGPAVQTWVAGKLQLAGEVADQVAGPALRGFGNILEGLLPKAQGAGNAIDTGLRHAIDAAGKVAQSFERDSAGLGDSLGRIASNAGELAHDALPVLNAGLTAAGASLGAFVQAGAGAIRILSPLAPELLATAVAIKGIQLASVGVGNVKTAIGKVTEAYGRMADAASFAAGRVTQTAAKTLGKDLNAAGEIGARAMTGVRTTLSAVGAAAPFVGVALLGIGYALEQDRQEMEQFTQRAAGLYDALRRGGQGAVDAQTALDGLNGVIDRLNHSGGIAGSIATKMAGGLQQAQTASEAAYQALTPLERANSDVAAAQANLAADTEKYGASSLEAAVDTQNLNFALTQQQSALDGLKSALSATTDQVDALAGAQVAADQSSVGFTLSLRSVKTAQDAYNQAVARFGPNSQQAEDALTGLKSAQTGATAAARTAAEAARTYAIANDTSGDAAVAAQRGNDAYRSTLQKLASQLAPNSAPRRAIEGWIAALDRIPREIQTHIAIRSEISGTVPGNFSAKPHLAAGGPVRAGQPVVVGDGGRPELFVPKVNGTILPRVPTAFSVAANNGAAAAHVVIELRSSGSSEDDYLVDRLRRAIRVRGGNVQVVLGK